MNRRTGPPKKPTNLKLIQGSYRADRAPANEARPPLEAPTVPEHLSDEAKIEWGRMADMLLRLGLLTPIDRAALAVYCEAWADWVKASREVAARGMVLKTAAGNVIENPYYSIKKRSAEIMHRYCTEFGLTPASRSRIEVAPLEAENPDEARWQGFSGPKKN